MAQSFELYDYESAMKMVLGTHRPDGAKIDLQPLLHVIDKILSRAHNCINDALLGKCDSNILTTQTVQSAGAIGPLASVIHKISCELQCKCSGGDAHESTIAIMKMLEKYEWDVKAAIAIAAFAQIYGEFCLFAQLYSAHPLAKDVANLKNLPNIAEHGSTHQHLFRSLETLIGAILELAKVMDRFDDFNPKYLSKDTTPLSNVMSMIHKPAYWVVFSVVVCTEQIASLAGISTEKTASFSVATLTVKVNQFLKTMQNYLAACVEIEEHNKLEENYARIKSIIENATSVEKILRAIFNWDKSGLIHCTGDINIPDEKIFRGKKVLILISGLDITAEEITALAEFYNRWKKERKPEEQAEIVWLPVIETRTTWETRQQKLKELRELMPWYTIENPSFIKQEAITYIQRDWQFSRKTRLVALDSSGKVQSKNALGMLWMWGDLVFGFNEIEEISLWEKYTNIVELIFGRTGGHTIDFDEVTTGKKTVVCFYGGEDIEWIKKLKASVKKVADTAKIKIELVYLGKKNFEEITQSQAQTWSETSIWLLWARLKSILYSSTKITSQIKTTLLKDITTLLTLDGNENGWAVYCGGSTKLITTQGDYALTVLDTMAETSATWEETGFVHNLANHVESTEKWPCSLFILEDEIEEAVSCSCGRTMTKLYAYKCCHDLH